jgi:hypothetical protein
MLFALSFLVSSAQAGIPVLVPSPILLSFELPIVARDLRHDGIAPDEVRAVIVGSRARHLHCDEIHATLLHSHEAFLVSGPVPHFDDLVLVDLDRGLRGPALFVSLDEAYVKHGKHSDAVLVGPGWGVVSGSEPGNSHGNADVHAWHNNNSKGFGGNSGHGHGSGNGASHGNGHGKGHGK